MLTAATLFMVVLGPVVAFLVSALVFSTARIFLQKSH